jgi:flagellar biogenesis protein FliO
MAAHTTFGWDLKRWLAKPRKRQRRLRMVETLSLGERRLVGVLEVDGREFLIGATAQAVTLLGNLSEEDDAEFPVSLAGTEVQ